MTWKYEGKDINSVDDTPQDSLGFIYKIVNMTTGKFYIGKKSMYSITNPQVSKSRYEKLKASGVPVTKTKNKAKSKKGAVVWRYKQKDVWKETNWKSYTGSSEELNEHIERGDKVQKTILKFCNTKKELTYQEVKEQFLNEVLERCDSYNENVLGRFFSQVKC